VIDGFISGGGSFDPLTQMCPQVKGYLFADTSPPNRATASCWVTWLSRSFVLDMRLRTRARARRWHVPPGGVSKALAEMATLGTASVSEKKV